MWLNLVGNINNNLKFKKMRNELTFTSISFDEQLAIIGGEDTATKPKKAPKKDGGVTVGDGNKVVINIFTFSF